MATNIKQYLKRNISIFLSKLYPYKVYLWINDFRIKVYSMWISTNFKEFGNLSIIYYPIVIVGGKYITIGRNTKLGAEGFLTAWDFYRGENYNPEIIIGDNNWIGEGFHITSNNKIIIGNGVLMGKKVTISDNSHGKIEINQLSIPPIDRKLYSKGIVDIKDNVWIGDKVTILAGVTIGKNAIIGANSVVTKDIPENCVAGGIPARVIKYINSTVL
jgi:acetyltransferase-like isoleucine patch superfamily enzyme